MDEKEMNGLNDVADFIKNNDDFAIVYHIDADGICAAGIACLMLKRLGKRFIFTGIRQLNSERLDLVEDLSNVFIFVDMGSGQLELLKERLGEKGKKYCVIDHHKPGPGEAEFHFNIHLSGYDGASDISGAGCTYLVAKKLSNDNVDLSGLAVVGAIGDMQYRKTGLLSLNRDIILKDAEKSGKVKAIQDLRLFGRHSRPLTQFLSYCSDPFIPGLTANEEAVRKFYFNLKIPIQKDGEWLKYANLSKDEKKRMLSGLYVYGQQHGLSEISLESLVGEVYELIQELEGTELRGAKEYSTLLNACGRHDMPEIGVKVCIGDRGEAYQKAKTLLQKHRRMLRDGIEWVQEQGVKEMKNLYLLDSGKHINETLIGVIAGMLYTANVIRRDKPIIAMAFDDHGKLKLSARATQELIRQGLDLGAALREVSMELKAGEGGGHNIAAGATILPEKKDEFLKKLDELIGKQLGK